MAEPERLDIEDDETRRDRIQTLLEALNHPSEPRPPNIPRLSQRTPDALGDDDGPRELEGPNALLARLEAFLPQLAASNAELLQRAQADPGSVDIENVEEGDGEGERYIEMNLGLGVFGQRDGAKRDDGASSSSEGDGSTTSSSDSESTSSSSSSSDEADGESGMDHSRMDMDVEHPQSLPRPTKALPRRALPIPPQPQIVVLASSSTMPALSPPAHTSGSADAPGSP